MPQAKAKGGGAGKRGPVDVEAAVEALPYFQTEGRKLVNVWKVEKPGYGLDEFDVAVRAMDSIIWPKIRSGHSPDLSKCLIFLNRYPLLHCENGSSGILMSNVGLIIFEWPHGGCRGPDDYSSCQY